MTNTLESSVMKLDANVMGELLRAFTFVGDGYGCYENFQVRSDATELTRIDRINYWSEIYEYSDETASEAADLGKAYMFKVGGLRIECFWFWDGDGFLSFTVDDHGNVKTVFNDDCKKPHNWTTL